MAAVAPSAATATANVATPISTSTINRRRRIISALPMLFIDGRFSRDRTVMTNVGHSCCRSYQRYADLLVGRHGEHRRFTILERQKPTQERPHRQGADSGRSMRH